MFRPIVPSFWSIPKLAAWASGFLLLSRTAEMLPASLPHPWPLCPTVSYVEYVYLTFPAMANIVYLKMNFFFLVIYIVLELICKAMS